jgi:hypothetical protein
MRLPDPHPEHLFQKLNDLRDRNLPVVQLPRQPDPIGDLDPVDGLARPFKSNGRHDSLCGSMRRCGFFILPAKQRELFLQLGLQALKSPKLRPQKIAIRGKSRVSIRRFR